MCKWKRSGWKFSSNAPEDWGFLVGVEKTFWESVSMVNVVTQAEKVIFTWMLIRFSWSVCSPLNSCTSVGDVLVVEEKETSPRVCSQHTHVRFFFFFFEPRNHQKECVRQYLFTRDKKNRKHDRNSLISLLEQRMVHLFLKKIK